MSMNKAIEHGKEKRKQYRGAKAVDSTCRNHGSCPRKANRTRKSKPAETVAQIVKELIEND